MPRFAPALNPRPGALLRQLLPSLAALAVLLILRQVGLSERLNLFAYDLAVQLRPAPSGATTPVRIIGIDEEDLARYGPLIPDGLLAEAVERLDRIGVRAIGLDLFCGQPVGEGWQRLRRLAATHPRLVSIYFDPDGKRAIPGTPPRRQAYVDLYTDPQDGVLRRDLLHRIHPRHPRNVSLPMRMLQVASGQDPLLRRLERHPATLASLTEHAGGYLPEAGVAAPGYLQRMLPFHQPGSFPTWSLRSLLHDPLPQAQRQQLRGSLVLIGVVAPSSKDAYTVPFSAWRPGERRYAMPGVEIHAHRLASLLALDAGQPLGIQAAGGAVNGLLLLLGLAAGVALGEGIGSLRRSFALVAAGLLVGVAAMALALAMGAWVDGALPLLAFALMATAAWTRRGANQQIKGDQLERQGRHVRSLFDQFVSKNVAEELLTAPPLHGTRTRLRNVTVLLSDLRGFSLLSEVQDPARMVRLLNNYLEVMVEVVETYGGTIDEVLGDALLVLFGAPLARDDHREAAVACALAMQLAMARVNQINRQEGLPPLEMGIGLCSGDVIAGTIGSQRRAKYGVVGEAVNLAARIEEFTVGGEVLAAESTVRAIPGELRIDAEYQLTVKGSSQPVRAYAIGAIAGTHNLALPSGRSRRQALKNPLPVRYCLLVGKRRQAELGMGEVTHLAEREAWMETRQGTLEPFANLVLTFAGLSGEAYGKVREQVNGSAHILFTMVPADLKAYIDALGSSGSPETPA